MTTITTSVASVINSLIETCQDGQKGFRTAADHVRGKELQSLFSELSLQRQKFSAELQRIVSSLGEEAESGGSFSGAVHRGWLDLKSAITSGEEFSILAECERGEDAAVTEYLEALEHSDLPAEIRAVLRQQYMDVQEAHDRVRDLRDHVQD